MNNQHLVRLTSFVMICLMSGCGDGNLAEAPNFFQENNETGTTNEMIPNVGGPSVSSIDLPVPSNKTLRCVQGVGGSYSHTGRSTFHDLDFDTSNVEQEEVFAAASGIAYVHRESANTGFGWHVNIDLGDGTYIVLAHMSQIFIWNLEEVAAGQLIGFEGCTGACTGDHIHIGLHEGDPARPAQYGVSIPVSYKMSDTDTDDTVKVIPAEDVVCGIRAFGDDHDGHVYRSNLAINLWHPDGSLIKTPDSPKVYRVEGGVARWIVDEGVFNDLGYSFTEVETVSKEELNCLGIGTAIDKAKFFDAAYDFAGDLWLAVGESGEMNSYRQRVNNVAWEAVLSTYNLPYHANNLPRQLGRDHPFFSERMIVEGYVPFRDGVLLTEESTSDIYVVSNSMALPIIDWQTYLLMGFGSRYIKILPDGAVFSVMETVGNCRANILCLSQPVVTECGGGLDLLGAGEFGGVVVEPVEPVSPDPIPNVEVPNPEDLLNLNSDQLGIVYIPPESLQPVFLELSADAYDLQGRILFPRTILGTYPGATYLAWESINGQFPYGSTIRFQVRFSTENGRYEACEQGERLGEIYVAYGQDEIIPQNSMQFDGECLLMVTVPNLQVVEDEVIDPVDETDPSIGNELSIYWQTPLAIRADYIILSGEYTESSGNVLLFWQELETATLASEIEFEIGDVHSGDRFRFSVEYETQAGGISWSCIGPWPSGTRQGWVEASVNGYEIPVETIGDPTGMTTGCGLILEIP